MKVLLEQAASKHQLKLLPPMTDEAIEAFEAKAGFRLAPALRQLYSLCGGHDQQYDAVILSFEKACKFHFDLKDAGFPAIRNYFPITDSESNPLCVCCDPILNGYIVHVYHDDVTYLKYRDLESFFANLISDAPMDWSHRTDFVGGLPSAMEWTRRTPADIEAAHKLIEEAKTLPADETVALGDNYRFAFTLFSENEVSIIAPFLGYPDVYIARDARVRLGKLKSNPLAGEALQNHQDALNAFLKEGVPHLKAIGLLAEDAPDPVIENERYQTWMGIPIFYLERLYAQRSHPAIWLMLVDLVKNSAENKRK